MKKIFNRIRGYHQPPYVINYWVDEKPYGLFCFTRKEERAIFKYIEDIGGQINSSLCTVNNTWDINGVEIITTIERYTKIKSTKRVKGTIDQTRELIIIH
jgi:hypothetical protein